MNEQLWNSIRSQPRLIALSSEWAKALLGTTFVEIEKLPFLTSAAVNEGVFMPTFDFTEITPSYLEFLREQVDLEPRGKEWAAVLKARMEALKRYTGKTIGNLSLRRMHSGRLEECWVIFEPVTFEIIYVENI